METALVPSASAPITKADMIAQGCDVDSFLPRLQLVTTSSDLFKEKKVREYDVWVLVDASGLPTVIGPEVICLLSDSRALAVDFKTDERFFDTKDPKFADIINRSKADPSTAQCAFGLQHLVYLVNEERFATMWFHNYSSKQALNDAFSSCPLSDYRGATYLLGVTQKKSKKTGSAYTCPTVKFDTDAVTPQIPVDELESARSKFYADVIKEDEAEVEAPASSRPR